jgi:hypothetical protein
VTHLGAICGDFGARGAVFLNDMLMRGREATARVIPLHAAVVKNHG